MIHEMMPVTAKGTDEGMPAHRQHCAFLLVGAFSWALANYLYCVSLHSIQSAVDPGYQSVYSLPALNVLSELMHSYAFRSCRIRSYRS